MIKTIKPSLEEGKNFGMSHPNGVLFARLRAFRILCPPMGVGFSFSAAKICFYFDKNKFSGEKVTYLYLLIHNI